MKIVFTTTVTDDWYLPCGCQKLERSAKYFHPEIPFITFRSSDKQHPDSWINLQLIIMEKIANAAKLANDYDLVICLDADQIIVDRLDELVLGDYEVAGVRNNHDFGGNFDGPAMIYNNMDTYKVLNCGLVAATNKNVWLDWYNLTNNNVSMQKDQLVFNELFYSGKYRTKLLDPVESSVYYGISNAVGRWSKRWQSWLEIQVQEDGLYLWGKKVKILHQAAATVNGVYLPERFTADLFNEETVAYLEKVTQTKFK